MHGALDRLEQSSSECLHVLGAAACVLSRLIRLTSRAFDRDRKLKDEREDRQVRSYCNTEYTARDTVLQEILHCNIYCTARCTVLQDDTALLDIPSRKIYCTAKEYCTV